MCPMTLHRSADKIRELKLDYRNLHSQFVDARRKLSNSEVTLSVARSKNGFVPISLERNVEFFKLRVTALEEELAKKRAELFGDQGT